MKWKPNQERRLGPYYDPYLPCILTKRLCHLFLHSDNCNNASGGSTISRRGRQLPTLLRFIKFVCQNERIGTLGGRGCMPGAPPLDPPLNAENNFITK